MNHRLYTVLLLFLPLLSAAAAADSPVVNANPTPSRVDVAQSRATHAALRAAPLEAKIDYLLDRAAITDLVETYAYSVDTRDWALHQSIFLPDYELNSDGTFRRQTADQRVKGLAKFFTTFESTQHLMLPLTFEITGDSAYVTASLHARHFHSDGAPAKNTLLFGQYEFWFKRTADGWLIARMAMVNRTRFVTAPGLSKATP